MMRDYEDSSIEWDNEDKEYPEGFWNDLPKPLYWRVIVMPIRAKEVTKGGIVLPAMVQDSQQFVNSTSKIIAMGWSAGCHQKLGGDGSKPHEGFPTVSQYVEHGKFAGQQLKYKGIRLLLLNDDELLCVVPNPESIYKHCA